MNDSVWEGQDKLRGTMLFSVYPWGKLIFGGKALSVPEFHSVFPDPFISKKKGKEKFYSEKSLKNAIAYLSFLDLQSLQHVKDPDKSCNKGICDILLTPEFLENIGLRHASLIVLNNFFLVINFIKTF